jgi:hypothetical protein
VKLILATNNGKLLDMRIVHNEMLSEQQATTRMRARAKKRHEKITDFHVYDTENPMAYGVPRIIAHWGE